MPSHRATIELAIVVSLCSGCELQAAQPSDEIQVPWQFAIEFALEAEGGDEYLARAQLFNALDHTLDPVNNAGKSLRLSEGDEVYAEGVHLDVETRTQWANRESFDYSTAVTTDLESYGFEFRRPDERIEATIPGPPDFIVDDVGERDYSPGSLALSWTPLDDERWRSEQHPTHSQSRRTHVSIAIEPLEDGCLTIIGGDSKVAIAGATNLLDTGSYQLGADTYHALDKDCPYDLIFERVSVKTVSGTWVRDDGVEVPSNGVTALARHTVRKRFVARRR
jgi:hypothetical protein